nr:ethylene-responsive transcription factor ERF023-like [Aegilops tauschii subsp. strangulata]
MPDPSAPARFADFLDLPPPRVLQRAYIGVRQRTCGAWVAEITYWEAHTRKWVGSFPMAKLAAMEYDRWQVQFHGAAARLNFPFGTVSVHLVPLASGMHPELVETERAIFADSGGKVIVVSDDKVQGGEEEQEFDLEEWQRIFPGCDDDGTSTNPCHQRWPVEERLARPPLWPTSGLV